MSPKLKKLSNLSLLSSLLINFGVQATQVVEGATERHVEVNIAAKEQNRLAVAGRQIVTVVPSTNGAITYQKDEALGVLYFGLASTVPDGSTVTLFVGDDRGETYKIILVPRNIPGDEIILKPPASRDVAAGASSGTSKTNSYQRKAKDMTLLMADEELRGRVERTRVNREVPLWKEGRLLYVAKAVDADIVGESYQLTNTSPSTMVLAEQELYRKGVRTIAIESHTLAPSESTNIFIVRDRKNNE